jgi:hypothetical protein
LAVDAFPLARQMADEVLSLPIGPQMPALQTTDVCNVVCAAG